MLKSRYPLKSSPEKQNDIQQQRDFLQQSIDSLTHPFYVINAKNYEVHLANKKARAVALSGATHCYEFGHRRKIPCNSVNDPCTLREVVRTKKPVKLQHTHFDENGKPRFVEVYGYPIFDEDSNIDGIIEYSLDVTDRIHTEELLRVSEEKHRMLFESSRDAIMTIASPSWNFTSGNQSAVELFCTKDEKHFTSLGPGDLSPEFQPDGEKSVTKAARMIGIAMDTGHNFFEWTHRKFRGKVFPATVLLTRVKIGNEIFLQATVRDVSEQKAEHDQLLKRNEELEMFNRLAVDRELKMVELKKQIHELKADLQTSETRMKQ